MAVQSNGITVVSVNNASRVIRFYVGDVEIALVYRRGHNHFSDVYRSYLDGRRSTELIRIPESQWRDMIRQAHGIAHDRGWKQ